MDQLQGGDERIKCRGKRVRRWAGRVVRPAQSFARDKRNGARDAETIETERHMKSNVAPIRKSIPLDQLAKAEATITRAQSLEPHRLECLEIARSKWKQARRIGASEYVVELLSDWVARLST